MQAHPAEKGQSQDLTRVCLSPRSVLLTSTVYSLHTTGVTGGTHGRSTGWGWEILRIAKLI